MSDGPDDRDRLTNREHWNELAALHGTSSGDTVYDVEAFLAGASTLHEPELAALPDVSGQDLLHLQCHFGLDSISWARRGARVTGLDFSPVAIERARELAERAAVPVRFVESDVLDLPADLRDSFDIVIATYGVLSWSPSIGGWFRSAAGALRPGGRLVVVDLHPAYLMVGSREPLVVDFAYGGGQPFRFDEPGSYADPELPVRATASVNYPHSLGEIVTAAVDAGLSIARLVEHLDTDHADRIGVAQRGGDGRWRLPFGDQGFGLPLVFSLIADRPPVRT